MIELQHRLREALKDRPLTQAERRRILTAVLNDKLVWTRLEKSPGTCMGRCEREVPS